MRTSAALRSATVLAAASALWSAPVRADDAPKEPEKIELKLSVKKGDVFRFRQKSHVDQTVKIGEMDIASTVEMTQAKDVGALFARNRRR